MKQKSTDYGTLIIGDLESIFQHCVQAIESTVQQYSAPLIGLTGGSTPKAFYQWATQKQPFTESVLSQALWSTSDERCVPLASDDSNFGHADRGMLTPLHIADSRKRPWAVDSTPKAAADAFNQQWKLENRTAALDLCFLGMGDDCHTASLFPQSPLIHNSPPEFFASVEVPNKGWRLTLTPQGLASCRNIIITVTGSAKIEALREVMLGTYAPFNKPVQLLKNCSKKVTWLIDPAAASSDFLSV